MDNLLGKYYKKRTGIIGSTKPQGRRSSPSTSTHLSTYTVALFTTHSSTNTIPDRKRFSQLNTRTVTISFSSSSPTSNPYSQQFSTNPYSQHFSANYPQSPNLKHKLSTNTTFIVSLNTNTAT